MTRQEVVAQVTSLMTEMFELDESALKPEARLFEDLQLDSIDAIDLAVKLQEVTGRRVDESALKQVRTVADVVELVCRHVGAEP